MRTDSLRHSGILAVVLRPVLHVVVTRTMHAARTGRAYGRVMGVELASRSDWTPTGRTSLLLVNSLVLSGSMFIFFDHIFRCLRVCCGHSAVPEQERSVCDGLAMIRTVPVPSQSLQTNSAFGHRESLSTGPGQRPTQ